MPIYDDLTPKTFWRDIKASDEERSALEPTIGRTMLSQLHLIRAFEEKVLELAGQGLVHGPAHSAIGQEGGAVGSAMAMRGSDQVNGSHRAHHQFLAKALAYAAPEGIDPEKSLGETLRHLSKRTLSEILGLSEGFCKGRGGSMHLRWAESGNLGTNAIVGGGVPMAAGAAWAHKQAGTGDVVYTYFGDGAVNIGSVLETMNIAAAWKLPICFFIENNRYAVSTHVEEVTAETRLSARGLAFGIPALRVDGMDTLSVYLAAEEANKIMRKGEGPVVIEADVYRYFHQNGALPGSAFGYRSKEEELEWRERDPLDAMARDLMERQIIGAQGVADLRGQCQAMMEEIAGELIEDVDGKRRIVPALWPEESFRDFGLRGDLSEFNGARFEEMEDHSGTLKQNVKFIDAVADVMMRRMETDDRVVVLGEDVHRLKGGTNGATKGLSETFPDRCLGTPIAENAFTGLAAGMAADGRVRPVIEFMYPDFMWVAADQVFNQIGKARHMFGGDSPMPLVLRTKVAMGTGYGSQHSMDPAGIFATAPGWRIVAPSTPYDYVGLMNAALQCEDPVLVLEHVDLYASKGAGPADDLDYMIPLGKAKVVREGTRVTVLTYLAMVEKTREVVERLGVDAEIIDLRSLDRAGLDWETIEASIEKTGNVLIVEQGAAGTSYGGWLSDELQRRSFDALDQPIKRVHGAEASPSISKVLEAAACARAQDIEAGLREVMADQGLPLAAE
ncbi:2-oxoisovalerate dehydrogenase E1 component [Aliiroseovarius crassostreae]|uniref:2-oxoglutarate dehydrogenase E1 component n=1 Tax=Aliiroseovarius crassostreae TaxID=154981 RepID=A0A0N8IBD5_9RHOB|nr:dehydrogenase E1 component subunit alpha/beta [Aliiroseovarius crassostreae]KPN62803.1 MFS transporter [Aliiroseovarius crassostreae]SFU71023.1 2-oxoisovalerate dehydrogenase E1 component [Aliiroseovarius crassostreae]